ncbi:MAG: hypothetical protein ACOX1N_04940 [Candidatus Methanomethylophilaceae archaeon]|jgi:hypothetical protein
MNLATILVGLGVAAFLIAAAYFTIKDFRTGGCASCKNRDKCSKKR